MSEEFVTVATFQVPSQASFYLSVLQGHDIQAHLHNEHFASMTPHLGLLGRGIELRVPAQEAEHAAALLQDMPPLEVEDDEEADYGAAGVEGLPHREFDPIVTQPDQCPNCGSENVAQREMPPLLRWIAIVLLLGIPLLVGQRPSWYCAECQWEWKA